MTNFTLGFIAGVAFMTITLLIQVLNMKKEIKKEKEAKERYKKALMEMNLKKGIEYEFKIGNHFKEKGYKVYFKGINEKKKDEGIDLICYKENEVLLVQCKNWKKPIGQEEIRKFIGDCYVYINKNQNYIKNKKIRKIVATSCKNTEFAV